MTASPRPWWIVNRYPNAALMQGGLVSAMGIVVIVASIRSGVWWGLAPGIFGLAVGGFCVVSGFMHKRLIAKGTPPSLGS